MKKKEQDKQYLNRGNRPDFSEYLSHFTKDGDFCNDNQDKGAEKLRKMDAFKRLCSILEKKTIFASVMPWTNTSGVCFTECPWNSLLAHTQKYSSYGIGFTKEFVYNKDGAPVFYMRQKLMNILKRSIKDKKTLQKILSFVTPYSPTFETKSMRKQIKLVDYTHEREWRTPKDLTFSYDDIIFLILAKHEDYDVLPQEFKNVFDRSKIIIMDNYRKIEELC